MTIRDRLPTGRFGITTGLLCLLLFAVGARSQSTDSADTLADSTVTDTASATDSASSDSTAEETAPQLPERLVLSIDRVEANTGQIHDTLEVALQSFGYPIAGFDIKLGVDSRIVEILDMLPGEIHDSCNWQFFDSRSMPNAGREGYPAQLWQAIALAETVPTRDGPVCFGFDREASLLRLVVASSPSAMVDDTSVAIYFIWEDCSDNSLADRSGNLLLFSKQVYDYLPGEARDTLRQFPTRQGVPKQCIDLSTDNRPLRLIELHNGGVEFRLDVTAPIEDSSVVDTSGAR